MVHILSLTGGWIYGNVLLWATWAHEYRAILSKLMGIARRGVLKELEVCGFEKNAMRDETLTWPPMQFSTLV